MGTSFTTGIPPGPTGSTPFNSDNEWEGDSRYNYDPDTGLLTVPIVSLDQISFDSPTTLIINSGEINITKTVHIVDG